MKFVLLKSQVSCPHYRVSNSGGVTQKLVDKEVGSMPGTAEFTCELNRNVEEVKWYFKKERILPSDKYRISSKGNSQTLRIRDVTEKDEGKYLVEAEGKTSEAWLYVEGEFINVLL